MALPDNFFSDFPPVSKAQWLEQISKDLKNKPLEELDWHAAAGLTLSPFAHADDMPVWPAPFSDQPHNWEICEDVPVYDVVEANRQAKEALEGGAEGLRFLFETVPDPAVADRLFDGIFPDMIGLHFAGPGINRNPGAILALLERMARSGGVATSALRGSFHYDPLSAPTTIVDWRFLTDFMRYARETFPGFKLVTVAAGIHSGDLAPGLLQGNNYIRQLAGRGFSPAEAARMLQFSLLIGNSYFVEIAGIRAFRLLWINVLKAWGVPLEYPMVEAQFRQETYTDDLYANMIRATTLAMSGILGGADRLTVLPCDAGRESQAAYPPAFGRRIARNVQHLLKMEAFFDQVPDAAAGSYYIEQLTLKVAQQAWDEFVQNSS
jgi:methylmalonyl-CoA mutase